MKCLNAGNMVASETHACISPERDGNVLTNKTNRCVANEAVETQNGRICLPNEDGNRTGGNLFADVLEMVKEIIDARIGEEMNSVPSEATGFPDGVIPQNGRICVPNEYRNGTEDNLFANILEMVEEMDSVPSEATSLPDGVIDQNGGMCLPNEYRNVSGDKLFTNILDMVKEIIDFSISEEMDSVLAGFPDRVIDQNGGICLPNEYRNGTGGKLLANVLEMMEIIIDYCIGEKIDSLPLEATGFPDGVIDQNGGISAPNEYRNLTEDNLFANILEMMEEMDSVPSEATTFPDSVINQNNGICLPNEYRNTPGDKLFANIFEIVKEIIDFSIGEEMDSVPSGFADSVIDQNGGICLPNEYRNGIGGKLFANILEMVEIIIDYCIGEEMDWVPSEVTGFPDSEIDQNGGISIPNEYRNGTEDNLFANILEMVEEIIDFRIGEEMDSVPSEATSLPDGVIDHNGGTCLPKEYRNVSGDKLFTNILDMVKEIIDFSIGEEMDSVLSDFPDRVIDQNDGICLRNEYRNRTEGKLFTNVLEMVEIIIDYCIGEEMNSVPSEATGFPDGVIDQNGGIFAPNDYRNGTEGNLFVNILEMVEEIIDFRIGEEMDSTSSETTSFPDIDQNVTAGYPADNSDDTEERKKLSIKQKIFDKEFLELITNSLREKETLSNPETNCKRVDDNQKNSLEPVSDVLDGNENFHEIRSAVDNDTVDGITMTAFESRSQEMGIPVSGDIRNASEIQTSNQEIPKGKISQSTTAQPPESLNETFPEMRKLNPEKFKRISSVMEKIKGKKNDSLLSKNPEIYDFDNNKRQRNECDLPVNGQSPDISTTSKKVPMVDGLQDTSLEQSKRKGEGTTSAIDGRRPSPINKDNTITETGSFSKTTKFKLTKSNESHDVPLASSVRKESESNVISPKCDKTLNESKKTYSTRSPNARHRPTKRPSKHRRPTPVSEVPERRFDTEDMSDRHLTELQTALRIDVPDESLELDTVTWVPASGPTSRKTSRRGRKR